MSLRSGHSWQKNKQGLRCASHTYTNKVTWTLEIACAYLSELDGNTYRFLVPIPMKFHKLDPVCDDCIHQLLVEGVIERGPDYL